MTTFYLGSTSLLIVVGVALDTITQIEARLAMRDYTRVHQALDGWHRLLTSSFWGLARAPAKAPRRRFCDERLAIGRFRPAICCANIVREEPTSGTQARGLHGSAASWFPTISSSKWSAQNSRTRAIRSVMDGFPADDRAGGSTRRVACNRRGSPLVAACIFSTDRAASGRGASACALDEPAQRADVYHATVQSAKRRRHRRRRRRSAGAARRRPARNRPKRLWMSTTSRRDRSLNYYSNAARSSSTIDALPAIEAVTDALIAEIAAEHARVTGERLTMVTLKSAREIEVMRRSGKITAQVLTDLMKAARPGMTTGELDRMAERGIRERGGIPTFKGYNGFPASICASVNEEVVHGIPGSRVLHDGDLLSIDIGTTLDGYVSDSAVTIPIGNVSRGRAPTARGHPRVSDARHRADASGQSPGRYRRRGSGARGAPRLWRRPRTRRPRRRPRDARGAAGAQLRQARNRHASCVQAWFWPSSR